MTRQHHGWVSAQPTSRSIWLQVAHAYLKPITLVPRPQMTVAEPLRSFVLRPVVQAFRQARQRLPAPPRTGVATRRAAASTSLLFARLQSSLLELATSCGTI